MNKVKTGGVGEHSGEPARAGGCKATLKGNVDPSDPNAGIAKWK